MDAALKALAEPRRRDILRLVWDHEVGATDIASHFDVTRPAISQHLGVLREAGLVTERRDGTRRLYRARKRTVEDLRRFLDDYWTAA
jgi:DNA-binding transcriptional ArsR family regulator